MNNQGIFINFFNNIFKKSQDFFGKYEFISDFIQKIIFLLIISIFILSTYSPSETLGIVALIIFVLTVFNLFIQKNEKFEMNLFEKFIFVWFLIVIVSLFGSSLFALSIKGFFKTITYMGFYFSVVQFYRKNLNLIIPTVGIIAFCAISQGIIGISQNFKGVDEISTWQDTSSINPEQVMTRIYGSLKPLNPNLFGGYLVSTIPAIIGCFMYFLREKKYTFAFINLFFLFTTIIALVLSGCRGAYIALFFMLSLFTLFIGKLIYEKNNNFIKKIYLSSIASIFTLGITAAMLITSIRTRIFSIFVFRNDSSTSFRFNVYQAAIQMIKDNWLFGIGVGNKNFREIYGLYMKTGFDALSTYNVFTELWVESGIFALLAFLAFVFFITKDSLKYLLKKSEYRIIVAISLISILSVLIHGLFDTIYFRPQVQFVFWTMVAFISAVLYSENSQNCKE